MLSRALSASPGGGWSIETVDNAGDYYSSLALDSSGNPHISYHDSTNGDLKYARWTGSTWSIETVDSTGHVGEYTSIALDSSGYPHISYYSGYPYYGLKYARWTGSSWDIQTVDNAGDYYSSLALDSSGNPHISYYDDTNEDLKYARWTGSSWDIQTVDSAGRVGYHTSIALDSSGNPRISYYDYYPNYYIKYARWTGTSWSIQTVDSVGSEGVSISIALDSSNYPHISYRGYGLKYARWTGSSWDIQTVDNAGDVGYHTSIALDSSGNPHISYRDSTNGNLKYARWTGSSWSVETVDLTGGVDGYTSIALDSGGKPHISYYNSGTDDLKYARVPNTSPTLTSGSVSPSSGAAGTIFTFEVTYADADGDAPAHVKVYIDGTAYSMDYVSGSYTSGALYRYASSTLGDGSHTYYFAASDGAATAQYPSSGTSSGPTISLGEISTFPWLAVLALVAVVGAAGGTALAWKKGLFKPKIKRVTKLKPAPAVKKPRPKAVMRPPKDETLAYIPVMCPSCGHPNFPHVKYCAECGKALPKKGP